jgi:hypothetical protein
MVTIKKALDRHNTLAIMLFLIVGVVLMLALSACSTKSPDAVKSDPKASSAADTQETPKETPTQTPPPVDDNVKNFGDVATYEDGVSISVALVGPFTPSETALPVGAGETPVVFKIVITNHSDKPLEPGAMPQANSGGKPATYIADTGNKQYGDLGLFPTTTILPGQTLEWYTAFGVVDPANITLEITPAPFDYANTIFTNAAH